MYVYWNVYYLAQTQYPCYLLLWLFFGLPPFPSPTPSPSITCCYNCFLVYNPFPMSNWLLELFLGLVPLFPQLPFVEIFFWSPPLSYSLLKLFLEYLPSVTCFLAPPPQLPAVGNISCPLYLPLQLPAVGTFYPPPHSFTSYLLLELFPGLLCLVEGVPHLVQPCL